MQEKHIKKKKMNKVRQKNTEWNFIKFEISRHNNKQEITQPFIS